ncbi:MAG: hypothetical protein AB8B47_16590 [Roseobacter sp.]
MFSAAVLEERAADIQVFTEELLHTWNDIAANPAIVEELRVQYNLLPGLPADVIAEAVPYFEEAVANGIYPLNGGQSSDAADDIAFVSATGQVEMDPADVNPADFWDFGPLEAAKAAN